MRCFLFVVLISIANITTASDDGFCSADGVPCYRFNYETYDTFMNTYREYGQRARWSDELLNYVFSDEIMDCERFSNEAKHADAIRTEHALLWSVGRCMVHRGYPRELLFNLEQEFIRTYVNLNR